jgi:GT2 family glycosyltransferase
MKRCSIIVPVFNAFPEALACLESVVRCTDRPCRILVVDDASTTGGFAAALPPAVRQWPGLTLLRNERNLGFVGVCNRGMREAGADDVVLLNSDTLVTPGWLRKLREAAYSRPRVATVTPLTNNGVVASVPLFLEDNALPAGYTVDEFAALVEEAAHRERPLLPTCVGFCTYIRREALAEVGVFDEERFGRGYGEENDFSCRAQARGFADLLDDATFVFHRGQCSFGKARDELSRRHMAVLDRLHPDYRARVQAFVESNPLRAIQRRIHEAMFRRWLTAAPRSVLHILHQPPLMRETALARPGGVEYHVADLIRAMPDTAGWSLYPLGDRFVLTAHVPGVDLAWEFSGHPVQLEPVLDAVGFTLLHLHQPSPYPSEFLQRLLTRHGNYVVSLHDYGLFCSAYHLMTNAGRVCNGLDCVGTCQIPAATARSRIEHAPELLRRAQAVFHFSEETRHQFERRFPVTCRWVPMKHGLPPNMRPVESEAPLPRPDAHHPLRVAFLGGINRIKGADLIQRLAQHGELPGGVPLEWHLVGLFDGEPGRRVHDHGRYMRSELPTLLGRIQPHLVAILSEGLETYCYTLDEALACGLPVVVTPRGAPAERVRRDGVGWVLPALDVATVLQQLAGIVRDWDGYGRVRQHVAAWRPLDMASVGQAYAQVYAALKTGPMRTKPDAILQALDRWQIELWHQPPWPRRLAGQLLEGGLSILDQLHIRRTTARIVGRLLPLPVQEKIQRLRHTEVRP